jgi:pyruvate/2-oxoglutarate dehydrogenase complex dihydrolipoamide dehydrogenase (E3) component
MARDGVRLHLGATLVEAGLQGSDRTLVYEREGRRETAAADQILVATGREPTVHGLGLETAGIACGPAGIRVDPRLRTTNRRVYAIGDVSSVHRFTHAADAQARLVVRNALFFGRGRADALVMPWCTYTSPEIAHVGMYEADARKAGIEVETITVPLADLDRAVLDGSTEGFLRVHVRRGTDRILGATLVSDRAGDVIGELALAITAGVGLGRIGATIHPYPTQGEIVRKAADAFGRRRLTPLAKRVFALFFRIVR